MIGQPRHVIALGVAGLVLAAGFGVDLTTSSGRPVPGHASVVCPPNPIGIKDAYLADTNGNPAPRASSSEDVEVIGYATRSLGTREFSIDLSQHAGAFGSSILQGFQFPVYEHVHNFARDVKTNNSKEFVLGQATATIVTDEPHSEETECRYTVSVNIVSKSSCGGKTSRTASLTAARASCKPRRHRHGGKPRKHPRHHNHPPTAPRPAPQPTRTLSIEIDIAAYNAPGAMGSVTSNTGISKTFTWTPQKHNSFYQTYTVPANGDVVLTATASGGAQFEDWTPSGGCSGQPPSPSGQATSPTCHVYFPGGGVLDAHFTVPGAGVASSR